MNKLKKIILSITFVSAVVVGHTISISRIEENREQERIQALEQYWAEVMENEPQGKYEQTTEEEDTNDLTPEKATVKRIIEEEDKEEQTKQHKILQNEELNINNILKEFYKYRDTTIHIVTESIYNITKNENDLDAVGVFYHYENLIYVQVTTEIDTIDTLLHEVAHSLDFNKEKEVFQYSDTIEFDQLREKELNSYMSFNEYAFTNNIEMFASSFAEIIINKEEFKDYCPQTFKYFCSIFNLVE